ncbi:3-ketosteroid 9alpha-monooxygenase subunit B [Nocardia amikacinitolerans]|uniref:3-ketosteroid-9-alpha-monooxygenase, ferredoxin reductase component n=1 Tax=Nocardia amikacinitolerans TaxID=756689 RepID=A0A285KT22_9NOCA|nr:ferredoxin--NADP reductase [Nocardia amikacinitolerans]MCP2275653.1 3-ketosteroid 9alpha-monooxygenase subunit B [Nocardia amikacinitolerans]SNY75383.1 3-ketosteroid 9alpha-monooxygenase subunit B [Nocardia amikacinitolerans]
MSIRLRVARVIAETADAVTLELVAEGRRPAYRPGQFLTLRIPSDRTGSVARSYSLSSAPHEDGPLKVTVKRTQGGYGSNWLCDNAAEGMELESLPPAGVFTPASLDDDLLLLAAGSGITPVLSIAKSALAQGNGRCTLVYANRDERSVIFAAELAELARAHPERLTVVHWLETVQGLPTAAQLRTLIEPWADRAVFVCGPEPFMDAVEWAATELGVDRVHSERFVSITGDPFAPVPTADDSSEDVAAVTVEIDGETHEFGWPRETVLLDVLLARGVEAPYSCREGACSACVCRLRDGEVKMLRNDVLEKEDLADGYVLACQAIPVTDTVRITYD